MRVRALAVSVLLFLGGCAEGGLGPGETVGPELLVRGAAEDVSLWDFCDPELQDSGVSERACRVPSVDRLRIGPRLRAASGSELYREWEELEWRVTLDGQALALEEFGTLPDTTLADGDPSGNGTSPWRVSTRASTDSRPESSTAIGPTTSPGSSVSGPDQKKERQGRPGRLRPWRTPLYESPGTAGVYGLRRFHS
jgi:hypothetical protein